MPGVVQLVGIHLRTTNPPGVDGANAYSGGVCLLRRCILERADNDTVVSIITGLQLEKREERKTKRKPCSSEKTINRCAMSASDKF